MAIESNAVAKSETMLLPCPFCGNAPNSVPRLGTYWEVWCPICTASIAGQKEHVIVRWNRRATSAKEPKATTEAKDAELPAGLQAIREGLWKFVVMDGGGAPTKARLDAYVELGLMERVQRSPGLWQLTDAGQAVIDHWRAAIAQQEARSDDNFEASSG